MKRKPIFLTLLILFVLIFNLSNFCLAQSNTERIFPIKDSYVSVADDEVNENYGALKKMYAGGYDPLNHEYYAYIYFDLSEVDAGWNEVKLYLHPGSGSFGYPYYYVELGFFQINKEWEETKITYNNRPSLGQELFIFKFDDLDEVNQDVTSFVKNNIFSFAIGRVNLSQDGHISIMSKELSSESRRPALIVSYSIPGYNLPIILGVATIITTIIIYKSLKRNNSAFSYRFRCF